MGDSILDDFDHPAVAHFDLSVAPGRQGATIGNYSDLTAATESPQRHAALAVAATPLLKIAGPDVLGPST